MEHYLLVIEIVINQPVIGRDVAFLGAVKNQNRINKMVLLEFFKAQEQRITSYVESVRSKSPRDKNLFVLNWSVMFTRIIGIPLASKNYKKPYWLSALPGLVILDCFLIGAFTIYYYAIRNVYMKCLATICISGIAVPVRYEFSVLEIIKLVLYSYW